MVEKELKVGDWVICIDDSNDWVKESGCVVGGIYRVWKYHGPNSFCVEAPKNRHLLLYPGFFKQHPSEVEITNNDVKPEPKFKRGDYVEYVHLLDEEKYPDEYHNADHDNLETGDTLLVLSSSFDETNNTWYYELSYNGINHNLEWYYPEHMFEKTAEHPNMYDKLSLDEKKDFVKKLVFKLSTDPLTYEYITEVLKKS